MNTEPKLISIVGEKPLRKYYVYYDEWSGEIINVSNKYKKSDNPHLLTEDNTAAEILLGHLNPKKYIINRSVDGESIMSKSEALVIKSHEDRLSKIVETPLSIDKEINVIRYIESMKLEINISSDTLYRMTGKRFNQKFSKSENKNNSVLYFYITEKNNPLRLIHTIEIDPIDLINNGYMLYDLSELTTVIGLNDIDVLTRRIFKTYGLKTKTKYTTVEYIKRKNSRRNHKEIINNDDEATFVISNSTNGWIFKSNFDNPHEVKIYSDMKIYITGETPFDLVDSIVIPFTEMGNFKEFNIHTDAELLTSKLLIGEEGKNVSFKYEELEYVKSGKY